MIYAFGGVLGTSEVSGATTDAVQEVDTTTGTARVVAHLPEALAHASAVVLGGRIFVLGGVVAGRTTAAVLEFHPGSGSFSEAGTLPTPLSDAAVAVAGGVGYLLGGEDAATNPTTAVVELRLD